MGVNFISPVVSPWFARFFTGFTYLAKSLIVGDLNKYELLGTIPKLYKGTHINHPKIRVEQSTRITIESTEQLLMYADGELLGECPVSFSVVPAALSIVA